MYVRFVAFLSCVCAVLIKIHALDNGLALTPPMGWLAWERYRCNMDCKDFPDDCIGEKLFMRMADELVSGGYKDLGYEYVNIDDCWLSRERDAQGRLQPDPTRFPSGIKNLSKYMHDRGLKLGIYEDFGTATCAGFPGSEFYIQLDAQTFADWEVDMLKFDGCNSNTHDMQYGYPIMGFFLNKTERPILYSCSWPAYLEPKVQPDYVYIAKTCNIWRNWADVDDSWDSIQGILKFYAADHSNFTQVAGPGNFNDPDMLIVGDYGLSYDQQRAQMALWAIMASPLFMSVDLGKIRPESKALLQNRNIITINQDKLGKQGIMLAQLGSTQLWTRHILPTGTLAFAVINFSNGGGPARVQVTPGGLGLTDPNGYNVTEIFDGTAMGSFNLTSKITFEVNPTGVFIGVVVPLQGPQKYLVKQSERIKDTKLYYRKFIDSLQDNIIY